MIIDSKQYNGSCSCGKEHKMETEFCIVESGCLKDVRSYMDKYNMVGYMVAVYDENTYKATADRHPQVDAEVILPAENLHANEHGVELLFDKMPKETQVLIAVGSGTIHDITRYCSYKKKIDFVSCPTAASVDGFCSSVAAMTWEGCKKTLTAVAPKIVVADLDIIKNAPIYLAKSGFGDIIGKYVSLTEWRIGNILTGEFYCDRIAQLTLKATENVKESALGIVSGNEDSFEKLMYGLLLSGLAMQMLGYSRPASGAEHHISHFIEMNPPKLSIKSDALHGEKVGVGTLLAINEYQRLSSLTNITFSDYKEFTADEIIRIFGEEMYGSLAEENKNDAAKNITAQLLKEKWSNICSEIKKLPDIKYLEEMYNQLGVKSTLEDIEVSNEYVNILLDNSPMVRNRLTLMRLRKCIN